MLAHFPPLPGLTHDDIASWAALASGLVLGVLSAIAKWQRDRESAYDAGVASKPVVQPDPPRVTGELECDHGHSGASECDPET